jgi:hypothetical protein
MTMLAIAEQIAVRVDVSEDGDFIIISQFNVNNDEENTVYVHVNNIGLLISAMEEVLKGNE